MAPKLSQALYDATIIGDVEEADRIRGQIDARLKSSFPKPKENVIKFNTVLNDARSSPRSIYNFMNKELGEDWWQWEIETIDRVLWLKFGLTPDGGNRDKVLAIRHLCNSDQPFWDWYEFNQLALSFSGSIADFEMLKKPSPGMIINAVKTMNYIRPDRNGEFGNDVIRYICVALKDDGVYVPPPSLYKLIVEKFSTMISDEIKNTWKTVYQKYQHIIKNKGADISEDLHDIQARRIFSAEAAALSYGS
jgi:hypothetical protein